MKYQIFVLGPAQIQFLATFTAEFKQCVTDIGLDYINDFDILDSTKKIDWDGTPIAVWFGDSATPDQADLELLNEILQEHMPVFPVVEDLGNYRNLVPTSLARINGHLWKVSDPNEGPEGATTLVGNIMGVLRLTRSVRQAFISYKRVDARGVATQLFDELSQRGYRAFLDTWSVQSGVDFQNVLWERMADVDLLIFLDSPNALTSNWVHHELAQAHDLGLGVLQLVWPNHSRTPGTEFSDWIQLQVADFDPSTVGLDSRLSPRAVLQLVSSAERCRIRSLRARRLRVVTDLADQAKEVGLEAVVPPHGPVTLYRNKSEVARVISHIGLPDALSIQESEQTLPSKSVLPVRMVYDGLGMSDGWAAHLNWLNAHNPGFSTTQVANIREWLEKI